MGFNSGFKGLKCFGTNELLSNHLSDGTEKNIKSIFLVSVHTEFQNEVPYIQVRKALRLEPNSSVSTRLNSVIFQTTLPSSPGIFPMGHRHINCGQLLAYSPSSLGSSEVGERPSTSPINIHTRPPRHR